MIKDFNGLTLSGKVCKNSIEKFNKFTKFSLAVKQNNDYKFYTCKVFNKVKEYFDSVVEEGSMITIQCNQSVNVWKDKEYIEYLVCCFAKVE